MKNNKFLEVKLCYPIEELFIDAFNRNFIFEKDEYKYYSNEDKMNFFRSRPLFDRMIKNYIGIFINLKN